MAMRRANGSGNVVKMKGNRRKPWRARVTVGWTEDGKQILKNIHRGVDTLCEQITGLPVEKYYRPTMGKYSKNSLEFARNLGYQTIFWSLASEDGNQDSQPAYKDDFNQLLKRVHPGAIVQLHNT